MASAASLPVADGTNSEPGIPTPEQLLERARAMIPTLKERARRCVSERDVPAESIAEMQAAGFFKILQPRRWGG